MELRASGWAQCALSLQTQVVFARSVWLELESASVEESASNE